MHNPPSIAELFPAGSRVLLSGTGRQFIERIGIDAAREVVTGVLCGRNIREQTEPLTRSRVAQVSAAMVILFAKGKEAYPNFESQLSQVALKQLRETRGQDKASIWPAQWAIGLTGKAFQNVLSGDHTRRDEYLLSFESTMAEVAAKCREEHGDMKLSLGVVTAPDGRSVELDWNGICRLTTAIGCAALTIRGSDKSIYGKLFERLVLGCVLSILGFQRINSTGAGISERVFWLGDSSGERECDATAIFRPGKLARFDIGFIGPGNSEISKDKLSRYAQVATTSGVSRSSRTFIVVDRLPQSGKTKAAARRIKAEIVQMSMKYWPRELALHLGTWFGTTFELASIPDDRIEKHLRDQVAQIRLLDFLSDIELSEDEIEG